MKNGKIQSCIISNSNLGVQFQIVNVIGLRMRKFVISLQWKSLNFGYLIFKEFNN